MMIGYKFDPTDYEIIRFFLYNKVFQNQLPNPCPIFECDLYDDKNSWEKLFDQSGETTLYFFTKLKKKTSKGSRVERVTSCGTWRAQNDQKIMKNFRGHDQKLHIGSRRNFTFVPKKGSGVKGRWVMHEYRLDGVYTKDRKDTIEDYVLCRVKKKTAAKEEEMIEVMEVLPAPAPLPMLVPVPVPTPPVNTAASDWKTSEELERILTFGDDDEWDDQSNYNHLITIEELERILAS